MKYDDAIASKINRNKNQGGSRTPGISNNKRKGFWTFSRWFYFSTIACALFLMVSNVFLANLLPTMSNEEIGAIKIGGQTTKDKAETKAEDINEGWNKTNTKIKTTKDSNSNSNNDSKMSKSMTWEELDAGSIFSKARRGMYPNGPKIVPTHLPLPIFVLNMPKSGSTTIHYYFKCGMGTHFSVHHMYSQRDMEKARTPSVNADIEYVSTCLGHNLFHDRPILEGCGGYSVYTDAGGVIRDIEGEDGLVLDWNSNLLEAAKKNGTNGTQQLVARTRKEQKQMLHREWCFYPGVHALDNIAKYYPYATILHLPRNATNWVKSTGGWGTNTKRSRLIERYELVCDGFENNTFKGPPKELGMRHRFREGNKPKKTNIAWLEWYEKNYTGRIREFASAHPTLTYFESPLEDPETPAKLQEATGIPSSCYGHALDSVSRNAFMDAKKKKNREKKNREKKKKDG